MFVCLFAGKEQVGKEKRKVDYTDKTIDWSKWRNHYWIDVRHGNSAITGTCKHCDVHYSSMTSSRGLAHVHKVEGRGISACGCIPEHIRKKLKPWRFATNEEEDDSTPATLTQSSFASGTSLLAKIVLAKIFVLARFLLLVSFFCLPSFCCLPICFACQVFVACQLFLLARLYLPYSFAVSCNIVYTRKVSAWSSMHVCISFSQFFVNWLS